MSDAPAFLTTTDVLARYNLKDPRAARTIMDRAGSIVVGHKLLVRADDLERYEGALRAERRAQATSQVARPTRTPTRRARRPRVRQTDLASLGPDWFEEGL